MEVRNIPLGEISPSPMNPRKTFDEGAIRELADNIRAQGLLQPITVRPIKSPLTASEGSECTSYQIVYGERRYRALKALSEEDSQRWHEIACIVREMTDAEALDAMITENLLRENVDPMEEAFAFDQLIKSGSTLEEVALRFGKSERFVLDRVKLNGLIPELRKKVAEGVMTLGAALIISKFDEGMQRKFFDAFGSYLLINKSSAERFTDGIFMIIANASWSVADKDYAGGCGRACAKCHDNTANAGCLFWQAKEGEGRCSNREGYEKKHMTYMLDFVNKHKKKLIMKGEPLEYGKTVLVDTSKAWTHDMRRMHDKAVELLSAKGYEIAKPAQVFAGPVYCADEERCAELVKAGQAYRCLDFYTGTQYPTPKIVHYYIKQNPADVAGKGTAPTEVVSLVGRHKRNIEIAEAAIVKEHSELARKIDTAAMQGDLTEQERTAFDMLILRVIGSRFLRERYKTCISQFEQPTTAQLREVAARHPEDRPLWLREYIRAAMLGQTSPDSFGYDICRDVLPIWNRKEYDRIEQEGREQLANKNFKIKDRLAGLGYDTDGANLEEKFMRMYERARQKHPDALLLFRRNDEYRAYFDDARQAADILGHKTRMVCIGREKEAEMYCINNFAADEWLPRLIRAGKRVAIIEE